MKLGKKLFCFMLEQRNDLGSWKDVERKYATRSETIRSWATVSRLCLTDEFVQKLNAAGYDIQLVKLDGASQAPPDIRNYSVKDCIEKAEEEGLTYGEFLVKYGIKEGE